MRSRRPERVDVSASHEDAATKAGSTPHPEDDRKPDSPAKINKPTRKYILKKTIGEFTADQCTDLAASLTYFAVFSLHCSRWSRCWASSGRRRRRLTLCSPWLKGWPRAPPPAWNR